MCNYSFWLSVQVCLLSGQEHVCSLQNHLFDRVFVVSMPKMVEYTGKWLLTGPIVITSLGRVQATKTDEFPENNLDGLTPPPSFSEIYVTKFFWKTSEKSPIQRSKICNIILFSIKHDLARSSFQLWPKIGDKGDKISRNIFILEFSSKEAAAPPLLEVFQKFIRFGSLTRALGKTLFQPRPRPGRK